MVIGPGAWMPARCEDGGGEQKVSSSSIVVAASSPGIISLAMNISCARRLSSEFRQPVNLAWRILMVL
jgi:hypothetical protein